MIETELRLISEGIAKQSKAKDDGAEKFRELDNRPEPGPGKAALGFEKAKKGIQIWSKNQKLKRANKEDNNMSFEQEQWVRAKVEADLQAINNKPDPEATRLKKGLSKLGTEIKKGDVRRDFRKAENQLEKLSIQKELLLSYKAKGMTDRDSLLARHELVSDMIKIQRSVKVQKFVDTESMSAEEKANLEKLKIEQETLESILAYRDDIKKSKVRVDKSLSSFEKVQARVQMRHERADAQEYASRELKKDLKELKAETEARSASPASPTTAGGVN